MPSLIKPEDLRERFAFAIHRDIEDPQISYSIVSASKRLRSWVGDATYDAAAAEDENVERRIVLRNAEGYLTLHFMMLALNTHFGPLGLMKTQTTDGGKTMNTYFSPSDVANFTTQYLEMAREIAEPYLLSDGTPAPRLEVIDDGE